MLSLFAYQFREVITILNEELVFVNEQPLHWYSTGFKYIEKINATAPQPQRNVLKYFATFKNVAHSLEPGETPSYSASHQDPNYVQRS